MTIREEDVVRLSRPAMNPLESVYLPEVVRGFGTTIRHFVTSFGQSKLPIVGRSKTTRTILLYFEPVVFLFTIGVNSHPPISQMNSPPLVQDLI